MHARKETDRSSWDMHARKETGVHGKSLFLPFIFVMNLKLLLKKVFKKKTLKRCRSMIHPELPETG